MAKKGLLARIIESFEIIRNDTIDEDLEPKQEAAEQRFVVPSNSVLSLMENNQPLSMWQINEVLNYIKSNYYFCEDKRILNDFAFEWTQCGGDVQEVLDKMQTATAHIVDSLSRGNTVNASDALWVSYKIYAYDENVEKNRIISKQMQNGYIMFDVVSQAKNPNVFNEIVELSRQLNVNKHTKTFANNYRL